MFTDVTLLPILVSAILAVAVGSIWYSPLLFGSVWLKSIGISMENADEEREMIIRAIQGVLAQTIFFFVLSQFILNSQGGTMSLTKMGVLLTAFIIASMINTFILEKKSIAYLLINAGYSTIIIFGGIGVIAFWPW